MRSAGRHEMCAAEGREEVVERLSVCQIQRRQPQLNLVPFGVEQIVDSDAGVEDVPLSNAGRTEVVVFRPRRGNRNSGRAEDGRTAGRDGTEPRGVYTPAIEAHLGLLVGGESKGAGIIGHDTRQSEPAVEAPGE